jgi:hypothetical protein
MSTKRKRINNYSSYEFVKSALLSVTMGVHVVMLMGIINIYFVQNKAK